ncbi:WxL domain-containing protein [Enterococcus sp. AZ109]|uniref:WxL domain-containing protein n=1 Tax=Enterococcus sp. AZ109 TaxID=2774634 RepID=UPI003F268589
MKNGVKKLFVLSSIAVVSLGSVLGSVSAVYAVSNTPVLTQDSSGLLKDSLIPSNPVINETVVSTPAYQFELTKMTGTVNEPLSIQFSSTQETKEVTIKLAKELSVVDDNLPEGVSLAATEQEDEWQVQSQQAQTSFEIPVIAETAGSYGVSVEGEAEATVEISEAAVEEEPEVSSEETVASEEQPTESEETVTEESETISQEADFTSGKTVEVTSMNQFLPAFNDPEVSIISLKTDVEFNNYSGTLSARSKSLLIRGNGYRIKFDREAAFKLGSAAEGSVFRLENITFEKPSYTALVTTEVAENKNWTVEFEDIDASDEVKSPYALVNLPYGKVAFTGGTNVLHNTVKDSSNMMKVKEISATNHAKVDIKRANSTIFLYEESIANAKLTIEDNAEMKLVADGSEMNTLYWLGPNPELNIRTGGKLDVTGGGYTPSIALDARNNAISMVGSSPKVNIHSGGSLTVFTTHGKRSLNLVGENAQVSIDNAEVTLNNDELPALRLEGSQATLSIKDSEASITSARTVTRGGGVTINGTSAKMEMENSHLKIDTEKDSNAVSVTGSNAALSLNNSSELEIVNKNGVDASNVVIGNSDVNPKLTINGGSKLSVDSASSSTLLSYGVRLSGSTPKVEVTDNSILDVKSRSGLKYGLALPGSNGQVLVSKGSKLGVETASGIGISTGANMVFENNGEFEVNATNSAGIITGNTAKITTNEGSSFKVSGIGSSATRGAIQSGSTLDVEFNRPKLVDIRNTRAGGGYIFQSSGGTLTATNTNLSVWKKNTNLDGDPYLSIPALNYSFSGANFNTLASSSRPDALNTTTLGSDGLTGYSRMSSDNSLIYAIADELRVPTTADKKIYGHVSLPAGSEDILRSAETDEVTVTVEVEPKTGSKKTYTTKTVGHSNENPGISIYGEEPKGGLFEVVLDDLLEAGSKVRISKVELTEGEVTEGYENQIKTKTVEAFAIIPPEPVKDLTPVSKLSTSIEGKTENKNVLLTATHNGKAIDTSKVTIDSNGKFSIPLTGLNLKKGDVIQVFTRDKAGNASSAGVVDVPATNNATGNIQPAADLVYHDTTFKAAPTITVSSYLLATADELRVPTNADKKIYGHVSMSTDESGSEQTRDAETDEVTVTVEVEKANGSKKEYTAKTVGNPGISIYGEPARAGLFEISLDDYLEAEAKVRVKKVELTKGDSGIDHKINTDTVNVFPIVPPKPVEFASTNVPRNSTSIQGHTDNKEVDITATLNGKAIDTSKVSIDKNGDFTISLAGLTLKENDQIQVFSRDHAGSAAGKITDVPATNNATGNIQPATELAYHDATFQPATILIVEGITVVTADELRVPTNADKKIYGHVSVATDSGGTHSAGQDEVNVTVEVEKPNGSKKEYTAKTVGSPGISIYGEPAQAGLFEIKLDDYLEADTKVRIKKVELTSGDPSAEYLINTNTVNVFPIVPPKPVEFASTNIPRNSTSIQGHTDNKEVDITATLNGEAIDTSEVVIDQNGDFTISLAGLTLKENDKIQVFSRDHAGSAAGKITDVPATNNATGNIQPTAALTYHDTTFQPATILIVEGITVVTADELRVPTNADKKIYGHVTVEVGADDARPAEDNEVKVTVEVEQPNGSKKEYTANTVGSPGISIYGEPARAGIFAIELGNFLEAGSKVRIKKIELSNGDPSSEYQINTGIAEVFPIVPPKPVEFTSTNIPRNSTSIQGHTENKDVDITATLNGTAIDTSAVSIDSNGDFTISLAGLNLQENDKIQVFSRDHAGSAVGKIIDVPETNNAIGNIQPATELAYHDTTFPAATILVVEGITVVTADELWVPTNADKKIYGHVNVEVGSENARPAGQGEVKVTVEVEQPNGSKQEYNAQTVGTPGISIYGEPARAGIFAIELGSFLEAGSKVRITKVELTSGDPASEYQINTGIAEVFPIVPPKPVVITSGVVSKTSTSIEGTTEDRNVDITATLNGVAINTSQVTVDSNGKFSIPLAGLNLQENDKIQIFSRDRVGSAVGKIAHVPATNNSVGNIQPATMLTYHDATFDAATSVIVDSLRLVAVDELRVPTTADKKIYGHVSITDGTEPTRPAGSGEVKATVEVEKTNGTKETYTGITMGNPGISIWGESPRSGLFEINLNSYLEAGAKVRVTRLEFVQDDSGTDYDISIAPVVVQEVTPPTPLTLIYEEVPQDITGEKMVAVVYNQADVNKVSEVVVTLNGTPLASSQYRYTSSTGFLYINFGTMTLNGDDKFQIFSRDKAGAAMGVVNPPVTNNALGNTQPADNYVYHDAVFSPAPIIKVTKVDVGIRDPLNPDTRVNPENPPSLSDTQGNVSIDFISQFNFGTVEISKEDATYNALPQRLLDGNGEQTRPNFLQISDLRSPDEWCPWYLTATLSSQGFRSEDGEQLTGAEIILNNQELVTTSSNSNASPALIVPDARLKPGNATVLFLTMGTGSGRGTWIDRFGNADTAESSVQLDVPKGANPKATKYTATVEWILAITP